MNDVDSAKEPINIISMCSGMRGIERGLERIMPSIRTVCHVEIEAFICENLVCEMEAGMVAPAPVFTDVKKFYGTPFRDRIHGIVAGYPCQPFSVAGKRGGTEDPRHLWPYIAKHIEAIRPLWCFFENVPGHINLGFEQVKSDLEKLHYKVEAGIFSAEEVGAPHQRKRLFILAMANSDSKSIRNCEGGLHATASPTSEKLGNTQKHNWRSCESWIHNETERKSCSGRFENSGARMASAFSKGLEGKWNGRCSATKKQPPPSSISNYKFPSRPNESQHEWEEPRTITKEELKCSLGGPVDGYNFREDLLRMCGNGVVPDTAELAYKTLINKFK